MRVGSQRHPIIMLVVGLILVAPFCAEGASNVFQYDLGILLDGGYTNAELLSAPEGRVFRGVVVDPFKAGDSEWRDPIQVTYLGGNQWEVLNERTGRVFIVDTVHHERSLRARRAAAPPPGPPPPPPPPPVVYRAPYFRSHAVMIKLGAYIPSNDVENMDTGFFSQFTYNHYFNPNFALEVGGGSFVASSEAIYRDRFNNGLLVSGDLYVVNLLLNLKLILPVPNGEFYAGVGPGVYFVYIDEDFDFFHTDDSDTVFGGQIVAGFNFNVSPMVFLGVEGQYVFTGDATLRGRPVFFGPEQYSTTFNMNGYTISGVIGFRF
jgi:hypothetical protein